MATDQNAMRTILLVVTTAACRQPAPRPAAPAREPIATPSRPVVAADAGEATVVAEDAGEARAESALPIPWLPFVRCEAEGTPFSLDVPGSTLAQEIEVRGESSGSVGQAARAYVHPNRPQATNTYEVAWALRDEAGAFRGSSLRTRLAFPEPDEERIEIKLITRDGVLLERGSDEQASFLLWAAPGARIARLRGFPCPTWIDAGRSPDWQPEIAVTADGFVCIGESSESAPRIIVAARDGRLLRSLAVPSNMTAALPARRNDPFALVDFARGVAQVHDFRGGVRRLTFPRTVPPPLCVAPAGPASIALRVHTRWVSEVGDATLADAFPPSIDDRSADAVATIELRQGGLCIRAVRTRMVEAFAMPGGLRGWADLNTDEPSQTAVACTPSQEPPPGD